MIVKWLWRAAWLLLPVAWLSQHFVHDDAATRKVRRPERCLGGGLHPVQHAERGNRGRVARPAAGWIDARTWMPPLFAVLFVTVVASGLQYVWIGTRMALAQRKKR